LIVIGCVLTAFGWTVAAGTARPSTPAETVKLTASGKTLDTVKDGTEVRVVAVERGSVPRSERPAVLELFGGYEYQGMTNARVLRRCTRMRCEVDPALRTQTTWSYQAFLVSSGGMVLAKSRIVKVKWLTQRRRAIGL
jgi:hypothetical protein